METRSRGQGGPGLRNAPVGTEGANASPSKWEALASSPEFRRLIMAKRNFDRHPVHASGPIQAKYPSAFALRMTTKKQLQDDRRRRQGVNKQAPPA